MSIANSRNAWKMCQTCPISPTKIQEWRQQSPSSVFIVTFRLMSHLAQVPPYLALNIWKPSVHKQPLSLFFYKDVLSLSNNSPLVFFSKYLQNEKRYYFAPSRLLVITYFERFCQISRENFWLAYELLWFCQRGTEKFKKKNLFFKFYIFLNNFFCKIFQLHSMLKW